MQSVPTKRASRRSSPRRPGRNPAGVTEWFISAATVVVIVAQTVLIPGLGIPAKAYALTASEAAGRLSAGEYHSLAVRPGGTVRAWGGGQAFQLDVPDGLDDVVAVAAGDHHSLALMSDGAIVGWGGGDSGWEQYAPAGVTDAIDISAGREHSLVLESSGTVLAAGNNSWGQCSVPVGLSGVGVRAVAAGGYHSLALKSDGTVAAWGMNVDGQCTVPAGLRDVVAVAAGGFHSLALKSDGTVVAWGSNSVGQRAVPTGLNGVVAIAASYGHSLALKSDGTVVAWGHNGAGQCDVPGESSGAVAIAAGGSHSLAMMGDGRVLGWGGNTYGQCLGVVEARPGSGSRNVPVDSDLLLEFSSPVSAGSGYASIVLRNAVGQPVLADTYLDGNVLAVSPASSLQSDTRYTLTLPFGALRDQVGNATPAYVFEYFTPDTVPPAIVSVELPGGEDQVVRITFDEGLHPGESFGDIVYETAGGAVIGSVAEIGGWRNRTLSISPVTLLDLRQSHTLIIPGGAVEDESGNAFGGVGDIILGGHISYTLTYTAGTGGTISGTTSQTVAHGASATPVTAQPSTGYRFVRWSDGRTDNPRTDTNVTASITVSAQFEAVPAEPDPVSPLAGVISGPTRYATAIAGSKSAYPKGAPAVVIATGEHFADALGGAGLAGALDSPLLLTEKASLPGPVMTEIDRLKAKKAYILGGTGAVSGQVESALKAKLGNGNVIRIAGSNRYQTADRIAAETIKVLDSKGGYSGDAFVATGANFPDALGASPVAASQGMPVFLADPARTSVSLPGNVKRVWITGGSAVVSAQVESSLKTRLGTANVKRLAGGDRFATAAEVAKFGVSRKMVWEAVGITTGANFPDALAAGPVLGSRDAVMLLTDGGSVPAPTRSALTANKAKITRVTFFGGDAAVPPGVRREVERSVE